MRYQLQSFKFRSSSVHLAVKMLEIRCRTCRITVLGAIFTALSCFCTLVYTQDASDFLSEDLNRADWTISNQNGSISFSAGQLPVMVLEALVKADQVDLGDPLAG